MAEAPRITVEELKRRMDDGEDFAVIDTLREYQCDGIQGYYFSKPLAVEEVANKLRGDSPEPLVRAQAGGRES